MIAGVDVAVVDGVARVARAASEPLVPAQRAAAVLDELQALVPFDHAELATVDPVSGERRLLANRGYAPELLDHLHGDEFRRTLVGLDMPRSGAPMRMRDVPGDHLAVRFIAEVLRPAGYREGLTMCLRTADGRETGMLNLSTAGAEHPTDAERAIVGALAATLANVTDATQSARFLLSLVEPGAHAVGIGRDGEVVDLPGFAGHPLLGRGEPLPRIARELSLQDGRPTRFLWPLGERAWHRVGVTPCGDAGEGIAAVVSVSAGPVALELTPRELEVLTMLTSGWSNAAIGARLWISPRTVGTYVERILEKLGVPTRAAAAARAVAEGLIVPLDAVRDA